MNTNLFKIKLFRVEPVGTDGESRMDVQLLDAYCMAIAGVRVACPRQDGAAARK